MGQTGLQALVAQAGACLLSLLVPIAGSRLGALWLVPAFAVVPCYGHGFGGLFGLQTCLAFKALGPTTLHICGTNGDKTYSVYILM